MSTVYKEYKKQREAYKEFTSLRKRSKNIFTYQNPKIINRTTNNGDFIDQGIFIFGEKRIEI